MLTHAVHHRLLDASCLASARRWRTHAELLRDGAEAPALTTGQRTRLLPTPSWLSATPTVGSALCGHADVTCEFGRVGDPAPVCDMSTAPCLALSGTPALLDLEQKLRVKKRSSDAPTRNGCIVPHLGRSSTRTSFSLPDVIPVTCSNRAGP